MQTHITNQGWSWSHQFGLLIARPNIYIKSINVYMILAVSSSLTSIMICFWLLDSRKEIAGYYKTMDAVDDSPFELAQLLLSVPLQQEAITKAASLLTEGSSHRLSSIFAVNVRSMKEGRNWITSSHNVWKFGFAPQTGLFKDLD